METREIIEKVLAHVGSIVNDRMLDHEETLRRNYSIPTEARASEDGMIVAIIQGLRNNLYDVQKKLGL